jgi:glycosyltransferase involved in cell wall biosynthesis
MLDASGVGVYLRGCLPHFLETRHDFLLVGDGRRLAEFAAKTNVSVFDCALKPFSAAETFFPPAPLVRAVNETALFYSPYFNVPARIGVPVYTTIHDIIFADMPELCSRAGLAARMWFYRRAARLSSKVFTVSRFSKSRIERHLGNRKPVIVACSGIQDRYLRQSGRRADVKKYILFIGNIKKHKGLSCLAEAFRAARQAGLDYRLIVAGEKDNFRTSGYGEAEGFFHDEHILFTGFVSDGELQTLIDEAALLVQPSLYEGFGVPPLEALVSGTPALVSDIAVFREIYDGFPVSYFEAGNSADLKEKLLGLLGGGVPRRVELAEALRQKYTFKKTAEAVLGELR